MASYVFLRHERPQAVVAFRRGRPVTVQQFLLDTATVAAALPRRSWVINTCLDRYRFAVSLAAAMLRRQVTLLSAQAPGLREEIVQRYPDCYEISDSEIDGTALDAIPAPPSGPVALTDLKFAADQIVAIAFTSGTTGSQMPHPKSWGALVRSTRTAGQRFGLERLASIVILGTVPQQHMYGLESTLLLALQHGGAFHAGRPFYPGDVVSALDALPRPRVLVTTPIHLRNLVADGTPLPPADMLLCATAPLAPELALLAEARFQAPLREIYGCSEAGQIAVRRPTSGVEWDCLEGFHLRQDPHGTVVCIDAANGAQGEEILLADAVELRSATRFLLHGRTSDLINIAGKRNSLAHLNYHLTMIEGVQDGIFVVPGDPSGITRLAAYVVSAPGVTAQSILEQLRQRVDPAFLPRPLRLVRALPRDANGKVTLAALQALKKSSAGEGV